MEGELGLEFNQGLFHEPDAAGQLQEPSINYVINSILKKIEVPFLKLVFGESNSCLTVF